MKGYPKFIFESNRIKELRKEIQKSFDNEELCAFYFLRPWSIYVSLFIKKYTNISANSITFLMMILSFIFPIVLFFLDSLYKILIAAPIIFYGLYFLDVIDGEVARLRKTTSTLGEFYDASLWFALPVLFSIYIYKLCDFQNLPKILFAIGMMTAMIELFMMVSRGMFFNKGMIKFLNKPKSLVITKIVLFFKFVLSKQIIYIIYPIIYILFKDFGSMIFIVFWSGLFLVYNSYSYVKYKNLKKGFVKGEGW